MKQQHIIIKDALEKSKLRIEGFPTGNTELTINILETQPKVLVGFNKNIQLDDEVISYYHTLRHQRRALAAR